MGNAYEKLPSGKVLVAEDNPISKKMIETLLRSWGVAVTVVENGREVLRKVEESGYDVLLLDYQMPELDGLQTWEAIHQKEEPRIKNLPVVLMTAEINEKIIHKLEHSGVKFFLRKPVAPENLYSILFQLLLKPKEGRSVKGSTRYLKKITNSNNELMAELIKVFVEESPQNMLRMKKFCLMRDWPSLRILVHKIKANYAYMGLAKHQVILADLEHDLDRQKNTHTYFSRIIQLEKLTQESIPVLSRKMDSF